MCSIKAKKYSTIYGGGETEVLVIKLQFVVAHLCAKVTRNKLRGNFFLAKNHALILNKTIHLHKMILYHPARLSILLKNYYISFYRIDVVNLNSTTSKCLLCRHILPVMTDAISKVCDISKGFHNKYRIHSYTQSSVEFWLSMQSRLLLNFLNFPLIQTFLKGNKFRRSMNLLRNEHLNTSSNWF